MLYIIKYILYSRTSDKLTQIIIKEAEIKINLKRGKSVDTQVKLLSSCHAVSQKSISFSPDASDNHNRK